MEHWEILNELSFLPPAFTENLMTKITLEGNEESDIAGGPRYLGKKKNKYSRSDRNYMPWAEKESLCNVSEGKIDDCEPRDVLFIPSHPQPDAAPSPTAYKEEAQKQPDIVATDEALAQFWGMVDTSTDGLKLPDLNETGLYEFYCKMRIAGYSQQSRCKIFLSPQRVLMKSRLFIRKVSIEINVSSIVKLFDDTHPDMLLFPSGSVTRIVLLGRVSINQKTHEQRYVKFYFKETTNAYKFLQILGQYWVVHRLNTWLPRNTDVTGVRLSHHELILDCRKPQLIEFMMDWARFIRHFSRAVIISQNSSTLSYIVNKLMNVSVSSVMIMLCKLSSEILSTINEGLILNGSVKKLVIVRCEFSNYTKLIDFILKLIHHSSLETIEFHLVNWRNHPEQAAQTLRVELGKIRHIKPRKKSSFALPSDSTLQEPANCRFEDFLTETLRTHNDITYIYSSNQHRSFDEYDLAEPLRKRLTTEEPLQGETTFVSYL